MGAVTKLRRHERFILNFPARTRDFCFVDDVVNHLADLLETPQCGATFREMGTGTGLSLEGASRLICERLGAPSELVAINPRTASDPNPSQVADASSPAFLECTTSFQDGIDELASRLIARGR